MEPGFSATGFLSSVTALIVEDTTEVGIDAEFADCNTNAPPDRAEPAAFASIAGGTLEHCSIGSPSTQFPAASEPRKLP